MSETTTVKGEIPARIAGVLIIIYGLIIFVTTLFVSRAKGSRPHNSQNFSQR
jgi:hypothetical protein